MQKKVIFILAILVLSQANTITAENTDDRVLETEDDELTTTSDVGQCLKASASNGCGNCNTEEDCGGETGVTSDCSQTVDKYCTESDGVCNEKSSENKCVVCHDDEDCGGNSEKYDLCWGHREGDCLLGFCDYTSEDLACLECLSEEDCGGKTDETVLCRLGLGEQDECEDIEGVCVHDAVANKCGDCKHESDCGGMDWDGKNTCQSEKDQTCIELLWGICIFTAPENRCLECHDETDCGGDDSTSLCSTSDVDECSDTYGYCLSNAEDNDCAYCKHEVDCGGKNYYTEECTFDLDAGCDGEASDDGVYGTTLFCATTIDDVEKRCQNCATEEDCGGDDSTNLCLFEKDKDCKEVTGFCKSDADSNNCEACEHETDCGGTNYETEFCVVESCEFSSILALNMILLAILAFLL